MLLTPTTPSYECNMIAVFSITFLTTVINIIFILCIICASTVFVLSWPYIVCINGCIELNRHNGTYKARISGLLMHYNLCK